MKEYILATLMSMFIAIPALAQQRPVPVKQPTGYEVKGCTYYKILPGGKIKCLPEWKEGYKQNLEKDSNRE